VFHWQKLLMVNFVFFLVKVGDFGILVRSGFTVSKALFFNFLSALVALAGTALVSSCSFSFFPLPVVNDFSRT